MFQMLPPISVGGHRRAFGAWDLVALLLVMTTLALIAEAGRVAVETLPAHGSAISLDPMNLPYYALRTTLRMVAALACSLAFTLIYATAAAKSRRAEKVLIPILDLLQSVPILGFISVTISFFLSLSPGHAFGAECAAIFAIFTSQAWNMAFSFYQSLRTVPVELTEVS